MQAVEELFGIFHTVPLAEPHRAPYPNCGVEPWPLLPVASRGRGAERGGLPSPRAGSQRVPVPERRDERTIVPGWAAVRAGHGHPTSPLCPQTLPLSFLPPTKTLGFVWRGKNPPHNPFIIFLGKVLAVFPLNPVSMRQPKLRAGNKPGPGKGGPECPRPGKRPGILWELPLPPDRGTG